MVIWRVLGYIMTMNLTNFIPTGRTSLIKKGEVSLQVQTEYAYRPYPRLTTTILDNGQVLHKIEKKLDKPIKSFEEQSVMEERMKSQHSEVVNIIKENDTGSLMDKIGVKVPVKVEVEEKPAEQSAVVQTEAPIFEKVLPREITIADRFKAVDGVKHVYHLNNDGEFVNKIESDHFKKAFSGIFKSIIDLLDIFSLLPGVTITREKGVYEVERNVLYLASAGFDICFIVIGSPNKDINYEQMFKSIVEREI